MTTTPESPAIPDVATLRTTNLVLLAAFQGKLAAALADRTCVPGTDAFKAVTYGLRLVFLHVDGLTAAVDEGEALATADPLADLKLRILEIEPKLPGANNSPGSAKVS